MGYKKLNKLFFFLFLVLTLSFTVNASEGVDLSGSRVITWGIDIGKNIISDIKVYLSNVIIDGDLDMQGNSIWNVGNISIDNITTYSNQINFNDSIIVNGDIDSMNIYPLSSLLYDLGSGPNRWRNLFVQNISSEYIETYNINALQNISSEYFIGSGAYLDSLNVSGDITGYALNISMLYGHNGIGGMDLRGDPWYLSGTDLQIAEDLIVNGDINVDGNLNIDENITAKWFNGKFNWTTADDWNSFNGYELEFNTSKLSTIYYSATQSFLVDGVIDGGTLADTQHPDGHYDGVTFNFSEQVATNALDLKVNFTGVEDFNAGVIRYKTSTLSGDYPIIQLWSYDSEQWEDYPLLAESQTFAIITQPVFDSSDHIQDGIVQMRLYKEGTGKSNNHYYVDWIAISKGFGTPAGEEIDPFSIHSDGDVPLSDNWDVGNQTISNIRNITINEYSKLGNLWICNYTITSNLTKSQEEGDC